MNDIDDQIEAEVMLPFLVIAKNHKQFDYWARVNGWCKDIKNYIYASNMEQLRSKRYRDILKVGEWWEAPILGKYSFEELKALVAADFLRKTTLVNKI